MKPRPELIRQNLIDHALTLNTIFTLEHVRYDRHTEMCLARAIISCVSMMLFAVIHKRIRSRTECGFQLRFDLLFHRHKSHNKRDMPRIQLKPQSPEFADTKKRPVTRVCDMPGCREHGEHKAPKDRGLTDHYYFCYEHVADYNKAWDFFSGMNDDEVQEHIFKSYYGDRPTWRYDVDGAREELLYRAAWKTYHNTEEEPPEAKGWQRAMHENTPETEALAIFGLEPPITLDGIKKRYKELAKKHHPDLNKNDPKAEDLLKRINMAYTVLKLAHEKFAQIEK